MPFNQIQVEQDIPDTIQISCANNQGFNIHCFVSLGLTKKVDLEQHIGERAYLCGKLTHYDISNEDINSWITALKLSDGFIRFLKEEFEKE